VPDRGTEPPAEETESASLGRRLKRLVPNLFLLFLGIIAVEVFLALASRVSPVVSFYLDREHRAPDPVMGVRRASPHHWDRDANGYRNARVLDRADIVALGDSHVAGTGVNREVAWPYLLATSLGSTQYNMGFGGYGPTHSLLQLDDALDLSPEIVLVGVYFGNDFIDVYEHMLINADVRGLADPELAAAAERHGRNNAIRDDLQAQQSPDRAALDDSDVPTLRLLRLYRALRAIQKRRAKLDEETSIHFRGFDRAAAAVRRKAKEGYGIFEGERWRTILTIDRRLQAMDDSDPRVRVGFELSIAALTRIKERLDSTGEPMCLVLLPTKELVFAEEVGDLSRYPKLDELVAAELQLRARLTRAMRREGIHIVDPLQDLRNALKQPYWQNGNGHPTHEGQRIIAKSVRPCVERALGES